MAKGGVHPQTALLLLKFLTPYSGFGQLPLQWEQREILSRWLCCQTEMVSSLMQLQVRLASMQNPCHIMHLYYQLIANLVLVTKVFSFLTVLAAGGASLSTSEIYDASLGSWSNTASMMTARRDFEMLVLSNGKGTKLYNYSCIF